MTNKEAAIIIIKKLREQGFEALLAGGCVRDMLLGREAKDYDVATSARPDEVSKLFRRTLEVGAKFGVVIVLVDELQIEVATFRTESGYADGRHPTEVAFTTAREDASRRDFTINAMFYDPVGEKVIDYFNGREDLDKRIIRTVGDARQRFQEDYLRMLRAVRFSAQLGFKIDKQTWQGVCDNSEKISKISGERIRMELEGILTCPAKSYAAEMLFDSGLSGAIFENYDAESAMAGINVLNQMPINIEFIVGLAGFLAGVETEDAINKCDVLSLSRKQNTKLKYLLSNRGRLLNVNMSLSELKIFLACEYFEDLYEFELAIQKTENETGVLRLIAIKERIKSLGNIDYSPVPLLNGDELQELGAVEGPGLGELAKQLYIAQLEEEITTKQQAKDWVINRLENNSSK
ncbi:MAG TPA: CCA tRNA nucleotidyltransferase [Sedimentisphaerales bacterium]|nr:CCA tRNA nucleotidyltransferase [Sedimentisphaerales bacterium]